MTKNYQVITNNVEAIKKKITGSGLMKAALAGGFFIEGEAKENANSVFSDKATNQLANSIMTAEAESTNTYAEVDVGPTVIYGRIHELGGFIKPVLAKALHFVIDGVHIVTQLVQMPARPYLRPAVDDNENDIVEAVKNTLIKEIESVT